MKTIIQLLRQVAMSPDKVLMNICYLQIMVVDENNICITQVNQVISEQAYNAMKGERKETEQQKGVYQINFM